MEIEHDYKVITTNLRMNYISCKFSKSQQHKNGIIVNMITSFHLINELARNPSAADFSPPLSNRHLNH